MSNAQNHIIVGTLVSLILAFIFNNFFNINQGIIVIGVVLGIISSEFPDVDHPKSLPRKIMKGLMPAVILFIFGYLFFTWKIWTKDFVIIGFFISLPIILIYFYEYFIPRHRGSTHKLPGMIAVSVLTVPFTFLFGWNLINFIVLIVFVITGFSTHILLDNL